MQNGLTPLFRAVYSEDFRITKMLLKHKPDVDARDEVVSGRRVGVCVCMGAWRRFTPCLAIGVTVVGRTTIERMSNGDMVVIIERYASMSKQPKALVTGMAICGSYTRVFAHHTTLSPPSA